MTGGIPIINTQFIGAYYTPIIEWVFTHWHTTHDKTVFKTLATCSIMDKTHHNWFKPHLDRAQQLVEQFNHRPPDKITQLETQLWFKYGDIERGQLHRDGDLPAIIWAGGTQKWYRNDQLHRDGDLPAVVRDDGTQEWYRNGQLHRDGDLPAIIWANGAKFWWRNGRCHRDDDLPAIIYADGTKEWFRNGQRYDP